MSILGILGVCVTHIIFKGERKRLGHKVKGKFLLGILMEKKGWTLYDIEIREIFVSGDVISHEDIYPFANNE